jgi:hypothetical protein
MLLLALGAAPGVTVAASAVERRFGSSAGGWLGAAPTTIAISVLAVAAEADDRVAAAMALSAATHVVAQVAFAVGFALVLGRRGGLTGLTAGLLAYAAVSLVVGVAPPALALAAAIPALAMGPGVLGDGSPQRAGGNGPSTLTAIAAGAAAVLVLVAGSLTTAALAGPVAAGVVSAVPLQSTAFALLMAGHRSRRAAVVALRGMILGLPGYLAFCLTLSLLAAPVGALRAAPVALSAAVLTAAATWRVVRGPEEGLLS